jgi:EmrB/QacA subfamily drug resistance transporter
VPTRPDPAGAPLWRVLPICLGTLIVPLDTAVNIAFPAITGHFGLALPQIQWVVICYVLTYGSLMLGIGRLGDIFGHALVFRLGLAWSAAAFLACAAAPDYGWLLTCRVLQGIGAALVISCGPALVTAPFPEAMRGRALGIYAFAFAAGSAIGPSLGGWLVARYGWDAVFWFRAPVALAALLLLPWRRAAPQPAAAAAREPFDAVGAALLALAIGTLLMAVNQARRLAVPGDWPVPVALAVVAAAAVAGFLAWNRRSPRPVVDLGLFRLPGFALVNAANALVNLAGFAVLLFVPYWLTRVAALPTGVAGMVLALSPLGGMLASPIAGRLVLRIAPPRIAWAGAGLTGAGLLAIGLGVGPATGPGAIPLLAAALLAHGVGLVLFQVAYTDIVTGTMRRADRGVAGSLAMVTRTLGIVTAASLLTLLFGVLEGRAAAGGAAAEEAFLAAFRGAFLVAAAIPALVLAAAALHRAR